MIGVSSGFPVQGHLGARGEHFWCFCQVSWETGMLAGGKVDGGREE